MLRLFCFTASFTPRPLTTKVTGGVTQRQASGAGDGDGGSLLAMEEGGKNKVAVGHGE